MASLAVVFEKLIGDFPGLALYKLLDSRKNIGIGESCLTHLGGRDQGAAAIVE
jgi:hypothetical protein